MLNKNSLIKIFKKLFNQAKNFYKEFNAADGKIGDGDLGITILHGLEEINNNLINFSDDMGENFMLCSKAFVKKSGSSFGTLIAFSFMNIAKKLKGRNECTHQDIIEIFQISLNTVLERGKAKLGDKTIADSLNFIIKEIRNKKNYADGIKNATKKALKNFKGKKILIGRARMFEDKTKELDDPGMLAFSKLVDVF